MAEALTAELRTIIAEEEALLSRVQDVLAQARQRARGSTRAAGLLAQLEDLRDDAAIAHAADLPHLLHQINQTRSLLEREQVQELPESSSPYFAHLRLATSDGARDYLLGRASYAETSANVRIVDWRFAPIARVFYSYEEGDDFEETFGNRTTEGQVEARRLVVIEKGSLTRVVVSGRTLERNEQGEWQLATARPGGLLSGGTGSATRPASLRGTAANRRREDVFGVTAHLDATQYEALSTPGEKPLLVLGSAGSGKTTVALHRLAKLAFDSPETFSQKRTKVIVPEEGLARLTRRLLQPMGLERIAVETLSSWSLASARRAFEGKNVKLALEPPPLVSRLKRHPVLRLALSARHGAGKLSGTSFGALRQWLGDAFVDREFLRHVVKGANGELPTTAIDETIEHTKLQLAAPLSDSLRGIDPEQLQTVDGASIEAGTPDELAGTVDFEDLPILLFLKAQRGPIGLERLAHVVLDEAEDFSLFELSVIGELLGHTRSCTIAGDDMQQTTSSFAGWNAALNELGIRDAARCQLQVSYRCPLPIAEFARKVLGTQLAEAAPLTGREGPPVGHHHFPDEVHAFLFIGESVRELMAREPHASVAVVASAPDVAARVHRMLEDMPWARLVTHGDFTFEPGVDVTDVDNVKGLEFDYVILADVTARAYPLHDEARRRLHVGATRASHQLWVVSSGLRSRLAPAPDNAA